MTGTAGDFRRDLRATGEILLRPAETFRRFRNRAPVLAPWLVASVLSAALALLVLSISQRAVAHLMTGVDSPELAGRVQASLDRMKLVSVGLAPLALALRWVLAALLLWAPAALASGAVTFRGVLSIVAYSSLPGILGKGVDLGVAWAEGPELTPDMIPTSSAATSLGALFPAAAGTPWAAALFDQVTPFAVWGLCLWSVGLRERFRLGGGRSWGIAGAVWLLLVLVAAAVDVLGRSLLGSAPGIG